MWAGMRLVPLPVQQQVVGSDISVAEDLHFLVLNTRGRVAYFIGLTEDKWKHCFDLEQCIRIPNNLSLCLWDQTKTKKICFKRKYPSIICTQNAFHVFCCRRLSPRNIFCPANVWCVQGNNSILQTQSPSTLLRCYVPKGCN